MKNQEIKDIQKLLRQANTMKNQEIKKIQKAARLHERLKWAKRLAELGKRRNYAILEFVAKDMEDNTWPKSRKKA